MDIAITGASGLIGTALGTSLRADGHHVRTVSRSAGGAEAIRWDPAAGTIDAAALEGVDAVVHLAGEPIASGPWTDAQRRRIHDSREQGTRLIATTLAGLDDKPSVLISGSAVGVYGNRGNEVLTEASTVGTGFLPDVCKDWEAASAPATAAGIRVVTIRTGVVLAPKGGALGAQLPLYKLGLGGKAGNGRQWLPWITIDDEVAAIRFLLESSLQGPVNLVAPEPTTNGRFAKALGHALHRPTVLPVPRFVSHAPFGVGPLLGSLLFDSLRVVPEQLEGAGFTFAHPDLDEALATVLGRR